MLYNVVSKAATKLIQTFLLNSMASSGKQAEDAGSEADESADDTELPPLKLPGQKFQELLHSVKDEGSFAEKCIASLRGLTKKKNVKARRNLSAEKLV